MKDLLSKRNLLLHNPYIIDEKQRKASSSISNIPIWIISSQHFYKKILSFPFYYLSKISNHYKYGSKRIRAGSGFHNIKGPGKFIKRKEMKDPLLQGNCDYLYMCKIQFLNTIHCLMIKFHMQEINP